MDPLAMIVGVGIFCAILLIIAFNLDEQHGLWKLFTILFVIFTLGIIVKASADSYANCDLVLVNTTVDANNATFYNYDEVCSASRLNTGASFMKSHELLLRVGGIYLLLYLLYISTDRFAKVGELFKKMFNGKQ